MFSKTTRLRFYVLLTLILLLTSLWPSATPTYAGPPPEDARLPDVADPGQGSSSLPLEGQGIAAPQQWDCYSGCTQYYNTILDVGDPISANSGAYHFAFPLLSLGGPMNLGFTLYYRSDFSQLLWYEYQAGLPERFWWSPLEHLEYSHDDPILGVYATAQIHDGNAISFKQEDGQWVPTQNGDFGRQENVSPVRWLLQETSDHFYLMDPIGEQVHIFQKVSEWTARIARIVDRDGNQLIYSYAGADELYPSRIEDGLGRSLDFTYQDVDSQAALVRVTDQAGRQITFAHEAAGADNRNVWTLRSLTDPLAHTTTFRYQTLPGWTDLYHLISQVERPKGNVPYRQTYDQVTLNGEVIPAVVAQQDAYGNTTTLAYDPAAYRTTETRQDGSTLVYEQDSHYGPPKSLTDAAGKTIQFSRDDATNRITGLTDRLNGVTQIAYHAGTGKIASYTNAEGHATAYDYSAQDQAFNPAGTELDRQDDDETVTFTFYGLTRTTYADSTHDDVLRDAHGNILSLTDRGGRSWTFTYNERGQPVSVTNPEGGVTTSTYNPDATLASSAESDNGIGTTTYGYDACKRLITITWPDGTTVHFTYDANNHLLTFTDERGKATTFTYDANGNRTSVNSPLGHGFAYTYDLMDRLTGRTDPLGYARVRTYDEMGRLETSTDRNGNTTTYTYDVRNWLTGITDPAGQSRAMSYDDESVPTAFTRPLGHTITYQADELGRIIATTDPLGAETRFTFDELRQLTSVTDRMGRTTGYDYDNSGRLAGVTRPLIGTATYTYNDLGLPNRITDLRGKNWGFDYTPMGRLISHTDPLGQQWAYAYDSRGRVQQTTYPDGGTATYTHDQTSNVTQIAYTGSPTLDFTYDDASGLLMASTGGVTPPLQFTYDARGDITNGQDGAASFGATYDDGQRLQTVTYDGQATVTYSYDARSLLTRAEDDLSGAWMTFAYDDDSRLISITRSNGVNTTFTYDAASRVTRIQDVGAQGPAPLQADQQYTLNAEGELTQVVRTLPLDPPPAGQVANLSYDDASQINSPGYLHDVRGRQIAAPGKVFTYDGADRLTSITADGSTALFTYNGLAGDLRARTVDGTTTTYHHNYALELWPIVAEATQTSEVSGDFGSLAGGYKRFYVYTPAGRLLYSIEPASGAVRFYHFDRVGSTLFLTDSAGAVSDAYAYDPYGVMLGHAGNDDQPFTYVGRYGVRWEPVGGLYHMRARYYDPATARFLTRDPLWPRLSSITSLNPYEYVTQNPLQYVDYRGTFGQTDPLTVLDILENPFVIEALNEYDRTADAYDEWERQMAEEWERQMTEIEQEWEHQRDQPPGGGEGDGEDYDPYGTPEGIRNLIQMLQQDIRDFHTQIREIAAQGPRGTSPETVEAWQRECQVIGLCSPSSTYQLLSTEAQIEAVQRSIDNAQASIRSLEQRLRDLSGPSESLPPR